MESNKYKALYCFLIAAGIALGAFAAHGLNGKIPNSSIASFKTGTFYLLFNALGLLILDKGQLRLSQALILIGSLLFSLSIFFLSTRGLLLPDGSASWLGPITPLGGLAMIIGWIMSAANYIKK